MEKEALKRIFEFLEENGEHIIPLPVKIKLAMPIAKEDLNVKGDLDLRSFIIKSLPKGLKIDGELDLNRSEITSLPRGLIVGGDLNLHMCKNITSLPEGLKVGGDIIIRRTLLEDYTNEEIREMIKPGFIKGEIFR